MDRSTLLHGGYEAGDGHLKVDVGCSPSQMILSELILTLLGIWGSGPNLLHVIQPSWKSVLGLFWVISLLYRVLSTESSTPEYSVCTEYEVAKPCVIVLPH